MGSPQRRPNRVLISVASPAEAHAVRRVIGIVAVHADRAGWRLERGAHGFDLIETGVGKAQSAAGTVWAFDPARHAGVLSVGVAGVLPGGGFDLCDALLASRSLFGDEGLDTPDGFRAIESLGFAAGSFGKTGNGPTPAWREMVRPLVDGEGIVATVSTCSGRDGRADELARRTGASAEAMEGAAIAAVLGRLSTGLPAFAEVRVISNTTGDRAGQRWDLDGALARLGRVVSGLDGGELSKTPPR